MAPVPYSEVMNQFIQERPVAAVVPLFADRPHIGPEPPRLDIDDQELELVIACGLALRDVAACLGVTMEDVCTHLVRFETALKQNG